MNQENDLQEKINEYKKIKAKEHNRKQRFIQRKKELGYSHISSLWLHLDPVNTNILKQGLKKASQKQLLLVINFLEKKTTKDNNQEKQWLQKDLLKNELIEYIKLKQNNKTSESLNELSIRLMDMGIFTKSRKTKRKTKFSTGSLSRIIKKITNEIRIND